MIAKSKHFKLKDLAEIQVIKAKFENKFHLHEKFKVRSWTQKFTSIKTKESALSEKNKKN